MDKSRLRKEMSRQAAATVTTHHVHLFSVKLSAAEMDVARKCAEEKTAFGNEYETERTYIEIVTLREALPAGKVDFTTLGMVMQTIGLAYDGGDVAAGGASAGVSALLESKDDLLSEKDKVIAQLREDLASAGVKRTAEGDVKAAGEERLTELAGKLGGLADEVAAAGAD